jgi:hypothetical protein
LAKASANSNLRASYVAPDVRSASAATVLLGPNYGEQKVLGTREAVAKIHRLMERQAGKSVELSVMAMGAHRQPLCPTTKLQKKRSS